MSVPPQQHALKVISIPPAVSPARSLQLAVNALLRQLYASQDIIGMQVAVCKDGRLILDTCAGTMGEHDPRPVVSNSLFNCFSVTKVKS
jgi:hypothetical protein